MRYSSRVLSTSRWEELKEPERACVVIIFPIAVPSEADKDGHDEDREIWPYRRARAALS